MQGGRALLAFLLFLAFGVPASAQSVIDCRAASEIAEQAEGLPPGLLFAIGRIETGRPNPATGAIEPWPWATNQAGIGHYFNSAQDAIAWTSQAQAQGLRSIDVGCFQINLFYHPEAFASLDDAFDPVANALYAARFLAALYRRAGGWPLAVAQYHSADPALGGPYGARVYSAWNGTWPGGITQRDPGAIELPGAGRLGVTGRATLTARVTNIPDPFVVRISVAALGVRVVLPSWAAVAPVATPIPVLGRPALPTIAVPAGAGGRIASTAGVSARVSDPVTVRMPHGGRLPRVYSPSGAITR